MSDRFASEKRDNAEHHTDPAPYDFAMNEAIDAAFNRGLEAGRSESAYLAKAEIERLRATIKHIYGAATEDVPGARTAEQSNAEALTYIARHIEG